MSAELWERLLVVVSILAGVWMVALTLSGNWLGVFVMIVMYGAATGIVRNDEGPRPRP